MLKLIVSAVLVFSGSLASAEVVQPIDGLKETVTMFMSLGSAPYRGVATGDLNLTNNSDKNLTDIKWNIQGPSFSAKDNCPKALAPGKSCRIRVQYFNAFPGSSSGTLRVYTSDKDYIVTVMAYGERNPWEGMPVPNPPRPPIPRP